MYYGLDNFPREKFDEIHLLVRTAYKPDKFMCHPFSRPVRVQHNLSGLSGNTVKAIKECSYTELYGMCGYLSPDTFEVWLNDKHPGMDPMGEHFKLTLMHELCHGYAQETVDDGHGKKWREYFCRLIYFYNELIEPVLDVGWHIRRVLSTYSLYRPREYGVFAEWKMDQSERIMRLAERQLPRVEHDFLHMRDRMRAEQCQESGSPSTALLAASAYQTLTNQGPDLR